MSATSVVTCRWEQDNSVHCMIRNILICTLLETECSMCPRSDDFPCLSGPLKVFLVCFFRDKMCCGAISTGQ